jgi:uncharacterized integral membrane protein
MSDLYRDQRTATSPAATLPPQPPVGPPGMSSTNGVLAPGSAAHAAPSEQSLPATAPRVSTPGLDSRGRVRRTRVSGVWVGLISAAIVLILFLVFILQNSQTVTIHFLGANGHLSFAVALLFAAVCGLLLVAIPGTIRIVQLRRALRKTAQLITMR